MRAASKFIGRLAQLDIAQVRSAIGAWRSIMRGEYVAWFAAERSAARAISASGRSAEQDILLDHVAECFRRAIWYSRRRSGEAHEREPAEETVQATEASGQYVATVAMLALLVRDRLAAAEFGLLYRPFVELIPPEELDRE